MAIACFFLGLICLVVVWMDKQSSANKSYQPSIEPLNSYRWCLAAQIKINSFLDDIKPSLEVNIIPSEPVDHQGHRYIVYKLVFSDREGEMPTWQMCIPETEEYLADCLENIVRFRCAVALQSKTLE